MAKIFTPARNLCACHGRQALRELVTNQYDGSRWGMGYRGSRWTRRMVSV